MASSSKNPMSVLTISNAVDLKTMEQLIPNLPKIMNFMKNGDNIETLVARQIKNAIMHNLADFAVLNNYVTNTYDKLIMFRNLHSDSIAQRNQLEKDIYKLWSILKNVKTDSNANMQNLSSAQFLQDICKYIDTLHLEIARHAQEITRLNDIDNEINVLRQSYNVEKKLYQNVLGDMNVLRSKLKNVTEELEVVKNNFEISLSVNSNNLAGLNAKNSIMGVKNFNLKLNQTYTRKAKEKFKKNIAEKENIIVILKEMFGQREDELMVMETNFMALQRGINEKIHTADNTKNKHSCRRRKAFSKILYLVSQTLS